MNPIEKITTLGLICEDSEHLRAVGKQKTQTELQPAKIAIASLTDPQKSAEPAAPGGCSLPDSSQDLTSENLLALISFNCLVK